MGDILLTTPIVTALKKNKPKCEVHFLSHAMGRAYLDGNPYIDRHITIDDDYGLYDYLRLYRDLRRQEYDFVFDFMNNPRSALLTMFSGALERVSYESKRRFFYSRVMPRGSDQVYIVEQKLSLLRAIDLTPSQDPLVLPWSLDDIAPLKALVGQYEDFALAKTRVILSPTHRREHRRWPKNHFSVLADYLSRNWSATVTWLWGPGEEAFIDEIQASCEEPTIKAPKTSIKEMAALIANHDVFVGNSNGPSHVAVATNICSLQLHGHTIGASWCPANDRHQYIQSPMNRENLEFCMPFITVPTVIEKLERLRPEIDRVAEHRRTIGLISAWDVAR